MSAEMLRVYRTIARTHPARSPLAWALVAGVVSTTAGCSSQPPRPTEPILNAAQASNDAIAAFDADADGAINLAEVEASPALELAFPRIDANGDNALDASEITERIRNYQNASAALSTGTVTVTLGGRPLTDAAITFEPEVFLGDSIEPCSGETDYTGTAVLSGHNDKFPGVYFGLYRVRVSKIVNGKEVVPSKYNTETTLGHEASGRCPRFDSSDSI